MCRCSWSSKCDSEQQSVLAAIADETLCYNETKTISTPAGTGYTYSWKKDGDAYGDNSASITTANEHGVVEYSLTVTDANNCGSNEINFTVTQPTTDITLSESVTKPSAYGLSDGSFSISINGGYGDYKYCDEPTCTFATATTVADDKIERSGIPAGSYSDAVWDKNGCSKDLTIEVPDPSEPNVTWDKTDALCNEGNSADPSKSGVITVLRQFFLYRP